MFGSGHSTFDSALVAESPYLELVFCPSEGRSQLGLDSFAAFIAFLFIDWLFGLCLPQGDPEGAWTCMFILLGWGFLALVHLIILPIWMLIASLRYWRSEATGRCRSCFPVQFACSGVHGLHAGGLVRSLKKGESGGG